VQAVRKALEPIAPAVPVHGCLCFVAPEGLLADSGLPLLRTLSVRGYPLYYPRRLAKRLNTAGDVNAEQAQAIAYELVRQFPAAR
jgi:hypothetical protein